MEASVYVRWSIFVNVLSHVPLNALSRPRTPNYREGQSIHITVYMFTVLKHMKPKWYLNVCKNDLNRCYTLSVLQDAELTEDGLPIQTRNSYKAGGNLKKTLRITACTSLFGWVVITSWCKSVFMLTAESYDRDVAWYYTWWETEVRYPICIQPT